MVPSIAFESRDYQNVQLQEKFKSRAAWEAGDFDTVDEIAAEHGVRFSMLDMSASWLGALSAPLTPMHLFFLSTSILSM